MIRRKSHGHATGNKKTATYNSWQNMIARCNHVDHHKYQYYGGKGITVCNSWLVDFRNFLADMGERPAGLTLDRIDSKGNYCKENCRWSDKTTQLKNRLVNNKHGYPGIELRKDTGKYEANAILNKVKHRLYYGPNLQDAIAARKEWEKENGY